MNLVNISYICMEEYSLLGGVWAMDESDVRAMTLKLN